MLRFGNLLILGVLLLFCAQGARAQSEPESGSPRIALVIGNGAYAGSPLPTAANDAGLVAQTLAAAGFDVTGARDLDGAALRQTIRDFLDKASSGGPRGIAMVYLAGYAVQADGENYFLPTDVRLDRPASLQIEGFRIADLTRTLAATTLGAKVVVIDGAHGDARSTVRSPPGLALVRPEPGTLLAFNAAPGTLAPIEAAPYGTYARLLTQTMKEGGVPVDEVFDRARVAMNTETRGAVVPWDESRLLQPFTFFDRADNAPALGSAQVPFTALRTRPLRDFSPEQAYDVAIARDTLPAYGEYLTVFPDNPLARRIRLMIAVRREALFWREALRANSAPAFWTYLRRYPKGPHGAEAQARLARLAAGRQPPPDFAPLAFDMEPPPEDEIAIVDRRPGFDEPDLPPPPPPPLFLLPPLPAEEGLLQPPPAPPGPRFLPMPLIAAIPFVRPIITPGAIMPPRGVKGGYGQPRPFMAAPGGGLVSRHGEIKPGTGSLPSAPAPNPPSLPVPAAVPVAGGAKAPAPAAVVSPGEQRPAKTVKPGDAHAGPGPNGGSLPRNASHATPGSMTPPPIVTAPSAQPPKPAGPQKPLGQPGRAAGAPALSPSPPVEILSPATRPPRPLPPIGKAQPVGMPKAPPPKPAPLRPAPTPAPVPTGEPARLAPPAPRPPAVEPRKLPPVVPQGRMVPDVRPPTNGSEARQPGHTQPTCGHPGQPVCRP